MQKILTIMLHKTAIIGIRKRLSIPEEGLPDEAEALAWYGEHFYRVKGAEFKGSLGFRYIPFQGKFDFDYQSGLGGFYISAPCPLDPEVPLDREVITLAEELNMPDWAAPALRLVLLVGGLPEEVELWFPEYLIAPVGEFRVLVHPADGVGVRRWRKTGEMMGLLSGEVDMWRVPGIITSYGSKRKNRKEELYWQTYLAYMEAIGERRYRGQEGKKGLLVETAKILEKKYGWECEYESYVIRRYLDRAQERWHISTRWESYKKEDHNKTISNSGVKVKQIC
jgi:hypothetical protein